MAKRFPMESVCKVQEREAVVDLNQERAEVSAEERERRERPVCSGNLEMQ
jgi:hypothetical protein